jgi:pyrimidine deaminase RibD-like protein
VSKFSKRYPKAVFSESVLRAAVSEFGNLVVDEPDILVAKAADSEGGTWSSLNLDEFFAQYNRSSGHASLCLQARFPDTGANISLDITRFDFGSYEVEFGSLPREYIPRIFNLFDAAYREQTPIESEPGLERLAPITLRELDIMRMAIAEARKCEAEDDRTHPKVSCVVVRDGEILAVGHRGELGPGEHAEFTVLEKKLVHERLAGSTIYATLEPCTIRNPPKLPCATHIQRRMVKRVVIGMLDPNQAITGKGVLQLRRSGIEVQLFPADLMRELEELNRHFIAEHSE